MKASALEFRFRYALHALIYVLGFLAPWNYALHLDPPGPNAHVWGLLAVNMASADLTTIGRGFDLLLVAGIICAFAAAALRTWGSAYLGAPVVQDGAMHTASHASGLLQDGPFRHLRNPLYVGTFLHTLALSLLMPRSGAIFTLVAIAVLQMRLILGEEAFLGARLGSAYAAYCALVPRVIPRLRPRVAPTGQAARWPQAMLGEIYMWGVALSFAVLGWRYNASLLIQCVLVAFGIALVARALVKSPEGKSPDVTA